MSNIPPFHPGQRVVAVTTVTNFRGVGIKEGETYVIKEVKQCGECGHWCVEIGLPYDPSLHSSCPMCRRLTLPYTAVWIGHERFAPIIEDMQAVTFEKVVEQEPVSVN
jgi:hypothetical protein